MEDGKKWKTANVVFEIVGGLCGLLAFVTSLKSSKYDEEQQIEALREDMGTYYGLTPVSNEEGASE